LQSGPATAEARQRIAVQSELDDLLDVGRVQHRHHRVDEGELALVRERRRLARVVVSGRDEHAAVPRRAGRVAVLERIARAVHPRTLAVPEREDAVVARTGEEAGLLRAPDRRRREILVETRLKTDLVGVEITLRTPKLAIEPAER